MVPSSLRQFRQGPPGGVGRGGGGTWSELRERARRKANCHLEDRMQEQVSGANVQNAVF